MAKHNDLGQQGEQAAADFLEKKGYKILHRNWQFKRAELDIVAQQRNTQIFVEVKTRSSSGLSNPEREMDNEKRRILRRTAGDYIRRAGRPDSEYRMDVLAIDPVRSSEFQVRHYRNAFRISL